MEDWGQVLSGLQGQTKQKLQTLEELLVRHAACPDLLLKQTEIHKQDYQQAR